MFTKNLFFNNGSTQNSSPLWVVAGGQVISSAVFAAGYSSNGTNWTGSSSADSLIGSDQGRSVVYRNGTWLVGAGAASTNKLIYSTDSGVTWTASSSANSVFGASSTVLAFCSNGYNTFVAGIYNGSTTIAYSTDGITWTASSSADGIFENSTAGVRDICWDGSKFVAVGSKIGGGNVTATSTDGITWTGLGSSITNNTLNAICWNGSKFVLGGNTALYTSTDATTWTLQTFPSATFSIFNRIRWNGSYLLGFGGANNTGATPTILKSDDGITWSVVNSGERALYQVNDAAWNGTKWIAVGQMRTVPSFNSPLIESTDGTTWTNITAGQTVFGSTSQAIFSVPAPAIYPPII